MEALDAMDQTTMIALAATGAAVVGAAVMYAASQSAPAIRSGTYP